MKSLAGIGRDVLDLSVTYVSGMDPRETVFPQDITYRALSPHELRLWGIVTPCD